MAKRMKAKTETEDGKVETIQNRRCSTCHKTFPLTPDYFRRSRAAPGGFERLCKWCKSASVKAHYINWTHQDLKRKGSLGVKCPLWTDRCGQCSSNPSASCWRLEGCDPEDYPEYNAAFHMNDQEGDSDG